MKKKVYLIIIFVLLIIVLIFTNKSNNYEYKYKGKTIALTKDNNTYILKDPKRNIELIDGSNSYSKPKKLDNLDENIFLDTYVILEDIYDFYLNNFNQKIDSLKLIMNLDINNSFEIKNGVIVISNNHLSKSVLMHEYTHLIIDNIISLNSFEVPNEQGSIKEAYSDIMSFVYTNDWIIGDNENIIRDISDPYKTENPIKKEGDYYYPNYYIKDGVDSLLKEYNVKSLYDIDKGGSHKNSTIISYSAYLMYKNNVFKDNIELGKIWFNSLYYLNNNSNFKDVKEAVIKSSIDYGIEEDKINIIKDIFKQVNI